MITYYKGGGTSADHALVAGVPNLFFLPRVDGHPVCPRQLFRDNGLGASCVGEDLLRKFPAVFRFKFHIASRSRFAIVFVHVDEANFNGFYIGLWFFGTTILVVAFLVAILASHVFREAIFFWLGSVVTTSVPTW